MSHKRKEIDEVTQKVQNTKKEIDHLKAELEKLINSGINSTKRSPFTSVDKENFAHNFHEPQHKPETRITFRNVSDVETEPNQRSAQVSSHVSRRDIPRLQLPSTNGTTTRNTSKSPDCNKKCSYNREEAREYIKKQKEKRKETAKLSCKNSLIDAEVKKQKLKELHQKSLQLLKKNVELKRKRSKSRESNLQTENLAQGKNRDGCQVVSHIPDLIMTNIVDNKTKQMHAQKTNKNHQINDKSSRRTDNVKEPCAATQIKPITSTKEVSVDVCGLQNKAAIKIQSNFRGYLQRKRYKSMKEAKRQMMLAGVTKITAETQTERKKDSVPDWLNPSTVSHPYNFISTVKRKLNFAVKSSPDVKIKTPEHSFDTNVVLKTPSQQLFQKTKDELKEVIQKSAKASKNTNGNLWDMVSQIRATNVIKSPELISLKPPQENVHSKPTVNNSDSDTSRNIPNISSEASTHSSKSKHNRTIVDTKNDTSLDTDYPTDSDLSEPKLNTDRLKHLQLQRKKHHSAKHSKEKETQKSKNCSSTSTIKTITSHSEANIYHTDDHKLSKALIKSFEDFPGKSTLTEDDILALNVSPLRSNTEEPAQEKLTEHLQPPTNLNLQLPKSSSREASLKSKSTVSQDSSIKTDTKNYSYTSAFSVVSSKNLLTVPSLSHPDVTMYPMEDAEESQKAGFQEPVKTTSVISLKEDGDKATINTKGNCNEIHLKIEAELHLLDGFNESLQRFVDLEKSVLELRDKHMQGTAPKENTVQQLHVVPEKNGSEIKTINYSRGSDVSDFVNFYSLNSSDFEFDKGILSTGLDFSNTFSETKSSSIAEPSIAIDEIFLNEPVVGASLGTFEQLIKDEDRRLEHLKLILKFREKTLLDKTKSELALLEIQRKHLKETGQLHEASLLKKKQRGILMRMQHEHHEMQRLKQMQKTATRERKADLKEKRNMIKTQLSTNKMLTKAKLNTPRENQRQSGPFKVYNIQKNHSESVRSETSISRNSITEEIVSVTSHARSVVSRVSDVEIAPNKIEDGNELAKVDQFKQVLLMRETALQQRRKAAEEVLQWHKKLSEEEKKVAELEMVAKSIIDEVSKETTDKKVQQDTLLQKMTKREGALLRDHGLTQRNRDIHKYKSDKFSEKDSSYDSINTDIDYSSDVSSAIKTDVLVPKKSEQSKDSSADKQTLNNYTSDFDTPTSLNNKEVFSEKIKHNDKIASITELIDNLTKINEENSILSKRSSLNKSIDAEIDKLASICTDPNSNSSLVKTPPKNFKLETNKLLNLKEHLHQDNSKAILDSIESLKSSIKEITSKADRNRISRRASSDTQSTEKDVSEISSESEVSVLNLSIPEEKAPEVAVEEKNVEVLPSQSEQSAPITEESEKIVLAADVSFENTPHISDTISSCSSVGENKEVLEKTSESESNASVIENLSKTEAESFELVRTLSQVKSSVLEDDNQNFEQERSHEERSEVTVEENKPLCDSQRLVETDDKDTEISPEVVEDLFEPILSASSPFIEDSKFTESENVALEEKTDLPVWVESTDDKEKLEIEDIITAAENAQLQFEDEGISEETSPPLESLSENSSPQGKEEKIYVAVDVKKRVSEILADANASNKNERSPRVQDLYVTTYDLISPENSPESYSPVDNSSVNSLLSSRIAEEAEELLKKQLAIEQEIKQIQQQHIPFIIMREIPNKPPPPYTPPVSVQVPVLPSVLPAVVDQVDIAAHFSADILYSAYLANSLDAVSFEDQTIDENVLKNIERYCLKFLFDVCKDLAVEHYEKFKVDEGPSWMKLANKQELSLNTPFNKEELKKYLHKKLDILLGHEEVERRENAIIRWSRKKRDHVDEILVLESQAEESEWTNYDRDELYVKNDVTNEIMNMLLSETAEVLSKVLMKKCGKTVELS